ncbi:penicillin-binding protein 2 [Marinovum sp. 2_MG-2023]|uniref:peptidoglycan D,D-transpeptidase FtsI family protein n=1 Tax=unclassified Marinovum TaxID=2647166 RepID=UPI0026E227AA|nr:MULTISPECIES: penicillin-binding protein 2 [unclassified Marinovum]MDO6731384.1 penicillin-binding protein 2 [Marinovum sp. 2_MG-2023]MDO6780717.1 penicillin-binding protein 2 [Marinovum sp. 1_MG-2023]
MIRTPLRPLARILEARQKGENPDAIERENIRLRHEDMRDRLRVRAEQRLLLMGIMYFCAFLVIGARMGLLAASEPAEPRGASNGASIVAQRADIVDRKGRLLATNMETHSLYAHPQQMVDPVRAAAELGKIFPDLDVQDLTKRFTSDRKFMWIRKKLSPEQKQAVHDIGEPGLLFGPREMRLYPNGALASHVLGGYGFGREGVHSAEVIGTAGIEKFHDDLLRDPAREGAPLELSLDLTLQAAAEKVLYGGMKIMNAKGAATILMDVHSGEVLALASLPDFDPNDRPLPALGDDPSISPLFNRAVQGVYELGSTFKIFAAAQAMDIGLVNPSTPVDIRGPLKWGKHRIRDFHNYGKELSVTKVIVKSSNIGTARLAQMIGVPRQKEFLQKLGFFDVKDIELQEAKAARPLLPPHWSELSTMTISYGHGLSASPLHLASAYATVANGGYKITPTLLRQNGANYGERVMSASASAASRAMLRLVVSHPDGTASFGDVKGYAVGGKTGTADKPKPKGGYYDDKVIATFASIFPIDKPKYVLIVTLDEPEIHAAGQLRRTAGWTAVPVAAEMIERLAPLLGLRPTIEPAELAGISLINH